jgi:ABC-type amino acid transport system permease subunit
VLGDKVSRVLYRNTPLLVVLLAPVAVGGVMFGRYVTHEPWIAAVIVPAIVLLVVLTPIVRGRPRQK